MTNFFEPAVPTTTMIISKKDRRNMVIIFDSNGKHGTKKVLPGGRVRVGKESFLETGILEAKQEVSITDLSDIAFFTVCSKPDRDVRKVTLEKYLDGKSIPDGFDENRINILAHYCFDVVLTAVSESEPKSDGDEAKKAYYIDVFNINPDDFALDHGHLLIAYAEYLKTGLLPEISAF